MKLPLLCSALAILAAMWTLSAQHSGQSGDGAENRAKHAVLQKRFLQLETEGDRIEDVRALKRLQRAYGYYVDQGMRKQAANLFADDGTLEIGGQCVFVGKARVLEYLTKLSPGGLTRGRLFNHIQLQPIIDVAPDGNTAKGRWRFLNEIGEYEKSATWGGGTYENEYVKEGSICKIKTLHGYSRFCTNYADGWGKSALTNSRQEKSILPDRQPTVTYESYPAAFTAAFHYKNPVSRIPASLAQCVRQILYRSCFENRCQSYVGFTGNVLRGARPSRPYFRTHNYREAEYVEVFVIFDLVGAGGSWNFAGGSSSGQIHPILACSGFERHHGEE